MRKLSTIVLSLLCLLMTACSNEFARTEYDSDEKISETADRYAKEVSVGNSTNQNYSLTVKKFNGRETLWKKTLKENQNITTVMECSPDASTDGFVTKTLSLKSGKNRLKLVGYDCENIDLKFEYKGE